MNKRFVLGLGSAAAVLAFGAASLLSGFGITQRDDVVYMTDGPSYSELADLTKASKGVVHVKILSAGNSYLVPFDSASPQVAPALNDGKKGTGTPNIPTVANPDKGVLKTDFTVEVLDNVRGLNLRKGQQIVVSQLGGTATVDRPDGTKGNVVVASAEHDPLMQVGDEEVLFLDQDSKSGKFFTTAGGQGRFKVQKNGSVIVADFDSPLAKLQNGKSLGAFKNAIKATN